MGRHSRVEHPRRLDERTTTGSHRAVGRKARRRVAPWPIACVALVALLVLGWMGWNWADGLLNSRAQAQGSGCAEGEATVNVVVTPTAHQPVRTGAARWNEADTVVRAHCVHVVVRAESSERVLDALAGRSDLAAIGGQPAAWIPESSWWVTELTTSKPELIAAAPESIAHARSADYPFLGLSGENVDTVQKHAAQSFRAFLLEPAQQAAFEQVGLTAN
ncbi:substrate-binding domain-containing protein [Amycolatopsis cihanbeyliensis]|uniref:Extracellular solute-binding protein n=1 Tax=Amycolatopsis cihanbeyliensis TaxID=1128664 RepID=A0A542DCK1_AMYCI|nr:substrate-binding domain-containing protein [Amycolatopsis cihanbeyliensis]TQJ00802.1 hypothetical protein FB471_0453 [Amycolatopsis cihanbeyliensis]